MIISKLREGGISVARAAEWFSAMWGIPAEAYAESMEACIRGEGAVPQWYLATEGDTVLGGLGVIENDFHPRKDLAPNICAVYVEEKYRGRGIAGELLEYACRDMAEMGIRTLYLVTDHVGFYEKYGWEYLCEVISDGEETPSRVYAKTTE